MSVSALCQLLEFAELLTEFLDGFLEARKASEEFGKCAIATTIKLSLIVQIEAAAAASGGKIEGGHLEVTRLYASCRDR